MAKLTEDQKRAFSTRIVEILKDNAARLTAAGFNPVARTIDLAIKTHRANDKEAAQVEARRVHLKATAESQQATDESYKLASDTVELIVGLLGKDDELSKILRNIRDEMANEAARGPRESETE